MPDGLLVTVPLPVLVTVSEYGVWEDRPKVAVTLLAASMVTVHVPVPLHPPPLQPVKVLPDDGDAVRVIGGLPAATDTEQVEGHEMPPPVTCPLPVPDVLTESW